MATLESTVLDTIAGTGRRRRLVIAFSGGIDSHVLLHIVSRLRDAGHLNQPLHALHVNHGLHPDADRWRQHCEAVADGLKVRFQAEVVNVPVDDGQSVEASARAARYQAFENYLGEGDLLLLAQHQDDQAETLLLQLLRGAGPAGLAAMPGRADCAAGTLLRPLLDVPRAEIRRYADAHSLQWVEDPGNADLRFDRNYLRHRIMPDLVERWPSAAQVLGRSARHCAEAAALLDDLAAIDFERAADGADTLSVAVLGDLSRPRQANLLRFWLRRAGLGAPSTVQLARVLSEHVGAGQDRQPELIWEGGEIRRFQGRLYCMPPLASVSEHTVLRWNPAHECRLPAQTGTLSARHTAGCGLRLEPGKPITIRYRRGGERMKPFGDRHTRSLKALMQEGGIPPWCRGRIPLLYLGDRLVAVADLWIDQATAVCGDEPGLTPVWRRGPGLETAITR